MEGHLVNRHEVYAFDNVYLATIGPVYALRPETWPYLQPDS